MGPEPVLAQDIAVVEPVQGLRFEVLAGGGERISITDPLRRAEWLVRGEGKVQIVAVLPDALLNSTGRGAISLAFGFGDLAYLLPGSTDPVLVSPEQPIILQLPSSGMPVRILLGGTAHSTGEESAGHYGAPLSLLVSKAEEGAQ